MTDDLSPWGLVQQNIARHSHQAAPVPDDRLLARLGELVDWAAKNNVKAIASQIAELRKLQDQVETAFAQSDRELERRHAKHSADMAAERKIHETQLANDRAEIAKQKQEADAHLKAAKEAETSWREKDAKVRRRLAAMEAA
jgi:hypothetical protein